MEGDAQPLAVDSVEDVARELCEVFMAPRHQRLALSLRWLLRGRLAGRGRIGGATALLLGASAA
eukprot:562747-Prymnesium_polylepis.1